jgi:hypothetical protein
MHRWERFIQILLEGGPILVLFKTEDWFVGDPSAYPVRVIFGNPNGRLD